MDTLSIQLDVHYFNNEPNLIATLFFLGELIHSHDLIDHLRMKDNPPFYSSHLSLKLHPGCTYSHGALNVSFPVATQIQRCRVSLLSHWLIKQFSEARNFMLPWVQSSP